MFEILILSLSAFVVDFGDTGFAPFFCANVVLESLTVEADAELLRRLGPCELDDLVPLLDEFVSESLELPLSLDDEPEVDPLDSDVVTD